MKLIFSPIRMDCALEASLSEGILRLNGQDLDLRGLGAGPEAVQWLSATTLACVWLAGDISCSDSGEITVPLILPHGPIPWPAPIEAACVTHPAPLVVVQDGPIALPKYEAGLE